MKNTNNHRERLDIGSAYIQKPEALPQVSSLFFSTEPRPEPNLTGAPNQVREAVVIMDDEHRHPRVWANYCMILRENSDELPEWKTSVGHDSYESAQYQEKKRAEEEVESWLLAGMTKEEREDYWERKECEDDYDYR